VNYGELESFTKLIELTTLRKSDPRFYVFGILGPTLGIQSCPDGILTIHFRPQFYQLLMVINVVLNVVLLP
jgi:hypothetical protein